MPPLWGSPFGFGLDPKARYARRWAMIWRPYGTVERVEGAHRNGGQRCEAGYRIMPQHSGLPDPSTRFGCQDSPRSGRHIVAQCDAKQALGQRYARTTESRRDDTEAIGVTPRRSYAIARNPHDLAPTGILLGRDTPVSGNSSNSHALRWPHHSRHESTEAWAIQSPTPRRGRSRCPFP
jgi:hypothetical protein